jgi:signal transduction histidine kinase
VSSLVDAAAKLADVHAAAKRITFVTESTADAALVQVERHRILQALSNLLSNALKFTPDGGEVRLAAWATADEVCFRVTDSGPGIAPEDLPHVFGRFWRKETNKTKRGLGLGLFIVKGIVEAHGGHVRAESTPGHGSSFTLVLPRAAEALTA